MIRRAAIVRLSAIGDVIHGLPLARSLRLLHPEAEITWLVQAEAAPLLHGHPWVDRTLLFPRRGAPMEILRFLGRVRAERFDLAVDVQGNAKSALLLAATGARRRLGPARSDCREAVAVWASNRKALRAPAPHSVHRTLALCRTLGDPDPRPRFGLAPTPAEAAAAREDLLGLSPPVAALTVGAAEDVREWPDASWVETARLLRESGIRVILLAGPRHAKRGIRIAREAGVEARAGTTDLRGLLAHLAVLAERGGVLVACDSAPVHLAVAVGLEVVVLSGPQDPRRTGPFGLPHRAMTRWEGLPCAPCLARRCRLRTEPRACMERIEPAAVARRARDLLEM